MLKKQSYHKLERMESVRKVRKSLLEFHQEHLVLIQYLTDYEDLQQLETYIFVARSFYENILKVIQVNRNKVVNAIKKQVEMIKNYLQSDCNGQLPSRSQLLQQSKAEINQIAITEYEILLWKLENENKKIFFFQNESQELFDHLQRQIAEKKKQLFKGLLPARVQQFDKFHADESHVGDQCVICMDDVEIGRNMMRLDCDGQHTFCQNCIQEWFAEHNTCPICRHIFE